VTNPSPEDLANYFQNKRGFKIVSDKENYILYNEKYVMIPKDTDEIRPKLLEKILEKAGISLMEFEQEFDE
jgi:predicted RNA binding protein YcfA (HicA-like mRNA interferase family)